jgi:hypothetical protein
MSENFKRENREIPTVSNSSELERSANADGGTADMHAAGKSDELVVPTTQANKRGCDPRGRSLSREGVRPRENHCSHTWPGHRAGHAMSQWELVSARDIVSTFDPR